VEAHKAEPLQPGEIRIEGPDRGTALRRDGSDHEIGDSEPLPHASTLLDPGFDRGPRPIRRVEDGEGAQEPGEACAVAPAGAEQDLEANDHREADLVTVE